MPASTSDLRTIFPIPNREDFFDLMYDRFHEILWRFSFLRKPYLLFINTLPRDYKEKLIVPRDKPQEYIYAGLGKLISNLEKNKKVQIPDNLEIKIQPLKQTRIEKGRGELVKKYFGKLTGDSLTLSEIYKISSGRMTGYFSGRLSKNQELERSVLDGLFPLEDYFYLSLPLLVFGEFDGMVHIIHHKDDREGLGFVKGNWEEDQPHFRMGAGNIIKAFSYETEAIWLDWEVIGDHLFQISAIQEVLNEIKEESLVKRLKREAKSGNKIFEELEYPQYYARNTPYYEARLKLTDEVTDKFYQQALKNAIVSILIDSYAHNVSAHSLTSLNWLMKLRSGKQKEREEKKAEWMRNLAELEGYLNREILAGDPLESLRKLIRDAESIISLSKENFSSDTYLVNYPGSMSTEMQPLLGYLMEKGAFWSGITRDLHYGGTVVSLFDLLWENFINNPLYLGTIAKTEGVTTLKLKIIVFEPQGKFYDNNEIVPKKVSVQGILSEINIKKSRQNDRYNDSTWELILRPGNKVLPGINQAEYEFLKDRSNFVQPGDAFLVLKAALSKIKLFLPGGIVGKHALFTMLENEIRNVKHYVHDAKALEKIRENGLTLALSVQEAPLRQDSPHSRPLYQLGIYLDEPTQLIRKSREAESNFLVQQRYEKLYEDIIDQKTKAIKLGGNYQDKICASMMLNNLFGKVQNGYTSPFRKEDKDSDRDNLYYPWVIPAIAEAGGQEGVIRDFQIRKPQIQTEDIPLWKQGYLKKIIHIWQGSVVKFLTPKQLNDKGGLPVWKWENPSRFKFLCLSGSDEEQTRLIYMARKEAGVIRLVKNCEGDSDSMKNFDEVELLKKGYKKWLPQWLSYDRLRIDFLEPAIREDADVMASNFSIIYDPNAGKWLMIDQEQNKMSDWPDEKRLVIQLKHGDEKLEAGNDTWVGVRKHGNYRQYFSESGKHLQEERMAELLESLGSKVAVFDSRARHRIRESNRNRILLYNRILNLYIFSEKLEEWENRKLEIPRDINFLIIHLTFIEQIVQKKYPGKLGKSESIVGFFIKNEIPAELYNRQNFILVLTTGRGRMDWWNDLVNEQPDNPYRDYARFVTFRPIESIVSAIEDAQAKADDIDLKYNLTKILFGS